MREIRTLICWATVTGPDGKGKIFYEDDLQKNADKIVNMYEPDKYANRFPSVTIDFARANVKKFGFIPCKEFTNDTTLPGPIKVENMYKTSDTRQSRITDSIHMPDRRQRMQCVGIVKNNGKTVGARFLYEGRVNDVTTEALMKHKNIEVQNAIIDKNGMVRGKPGVKLPIIKM